MATAVLVLCSVLAHRTAPHYRMFTVLPHRTALHYRMFTVPYHITLLPALPYCKRTLRIVPCRTQ